MPVTTFAGHDNEVTSLAYSADGSRIASVSADSVCFWAPSTGKEIKRMKSGAYQVNAFSPDLSRLAIASSFHYEVQKPHHGTMRLLDTDTGNQIWSINPHGDWDKNFPFRPLITAVSFSSDGKWLATSASVTKVGGRHGSPGGVVKLWDVETGKEVWQRDRLSTRAETVAFSPDGKYVASSTGGAGGELPEPGEVNVFKAETSDRILSFSQSSTAALAFNRTSTRLASALSDGTVRIREFPSGRLLLTLTAHTGAPGVSETDQTGLILGRQKAVRCIAFSPDGSCLAAAGYDRVLRVWNAETGAETNAFPFDAARINAVTFSPDGRHLAGGGGDPMKPGKVVLWQLANK